GYAQATLSSALKRTLDGLKESETRRKEIYIVTDMQKLAWDEGITQQTRRVLDDKKFKDMPLFLVDVGAVVTTNLTVTRADFGTRMNVEGSVSNLFTTVKNTGSQGIIQDLSLHIDGDKIHETEVGTNAGQTKNITMEHTFERKGFYTGFVELDPDDLPGDNRRYFTVEVSDKVPVLIVNGDPSVIPHQDGSFYLNLALGGMSKNNASLSPIEPRVITDRELQSERLSNYATVVLANVSTITPQMAQSLTNYVRNGGGLLIFLGHNVDPASYNMAIGKAAEETVEVVAHKGGENPEVKEKKDVARSFELLPANLGQVRTPKGEDAYFSVWNQNARHPILRDIIRDIKLNRAQIKRFFALQESPDHGTTGTELITLNAGPLMVEQKFGSGSVILFTISCTPGWSNIPLKPFFLPLLHQTIYYLARTSSQRSSTPVGMAYRLPIPEVEETTKVSFYPPPTEEQKREGRTPEPITVKSELGRAGHSAIFKQTNRPGIYRAEVAVGKGLRRELFAVNVPLKESNLSRIPVSEVQKRIDLEDFTIVEDPEKLGQIVRRAREGLPLWDYFLLAALLLALATSYLGNVVLKHGASETEETV
ncbi:MAG: hypothetical protein KGZ25_13605, partial [Planctomycetes bacterium]|nr:hypothetical protein [Planctomycetota bacterium]